MPLDSRMSERFSRMYFYHRAGWCERFVWLPRRCELSGRIIWLRRAYRGTVLWHGPGTPTIETVWHDRSEHLVWILKNV